MDSLKCFALFAVCLIASTCSAAVPAPYQVSLRLYDNFSPNNGGSFSLCSGAIIHPMFVLTTAHCTHTHIISQQISRPLPPNAIYVMAGNFSGGSQSVKHVADIFVHPAYNGETYENNIALIKLNSPFDLQNSTDLEWLELPENSTRLQNCFHVFNNASAKGAYPFTAQQSISVADNWFCQKNNANFTSPITKTEICSYYTFSDSFMCKVTENQLKINNDRGTPLVCNDKLVGLLSVIIPPTNTTNSTESVCDTNLRTPAYYTRVATYNSWIHSVIGVNLPATIDGQPQPVIPSSPPFHGPTTPKPPKATASITGLSMSLAISAAVTWLLVTNCFRRV